MAAKKLLYAVLLAAILTACAARSNVIQGPTMGMDGMMQRHMAPIPEKYAGMTNPEPTDDASLERGKTIYETHCATCHGDEGWGDGPSAANLDPPPAPLAHTSHMLSDGYLYYRISEGGEFPPYNSSMPAWNEVLDEIQRWDVINYIRSFSDGTNGMMRGTEKMDGGMMSWMMLIGGVVSLLLLIGLLGLIIVGAIWIVRKTQEQIPKSETAIEILKRRYARGEISAEEFERMKQQLSE